MSIYPSSYPNRTRYSFDSKPFDDDENHVSNFSVFLLICNVKIYATFYYQFLIQYNQKWNSCRMLTEDVCMYEVTVAWHPKVVSMTFSLGLTISYTCTHRFCAWIQEHVEEVIFDLFKIQYVWKHSLFVIYLSHFKHHRVLIFCLRTTNIYIILVIFQ